MKVLLIDDNLDITDSFRLFLELSGFTVFSADEGAAGVELAVTHQPDAIFCDLNLPIVDGFVVARQIRERLTTPFKMFALTGSGWKTSEEQLHKTGFDRVFYKPLDPIFLVEFLNQMQQECNV